MKLLVTGVKGQLGHDVVNELKRRGHKHKIKGNHPTTTTKRMEQRRNIESTGKQDLKWQ